jgi:hypothetical protein
VRFRDDTRGVTVQVGAVLLFATIIIALSVYQASVVPAENSDVEYRHSQQVQGQLVDVRNALVSTAATGDGGPATVSLGTEYPNRVFLVNPPPPAGTLRTSTYDNPNVTVSNVNATNDETRDYLDGSWAQPTKALSYVPGYNEYRDAPRLRYEASVLSNYYPDQNTSVPLTEQLVVDEQTRTVSLVALNGSLSTSRSSSVAVDPTALSAPAERVQVQPQNPGQPVNVTIPTVVDASVLRNSTSLGDSPNVTVTQNGTDRVTLSVDWDDPFTLRTAKVGVGSGATNPAPHYLTLVESDDDSVTVEARDEYNNPESGGLVSTNRSDVFEDADGNRTTNEDGRVTFEVDGDQPKTPVRFELVDGEGGFAQRTVNETVGESATPVVGNGSGGSLVYLGDGTALDGGDDDTNPGGFNFTVRNTHSTNISLTDVTVLPESDDTTGLSDESDGFGPGQSELHVASRNDSEESANVEAPLFSGPFVDDQYVTVGSRGLTLSLAENRTEETYDSGGGTGTVTTNQSGGPVELGTGHEAEVTFAEFFDGSTERNVTNDDFRVVVAYDRNGERETSEFVVYAEAPSDVDGGGGGGGGQAVQAVEADGVTGGTQLTFTVENAGDESVTVTDFAVDASSIGGDVKINNGDSDELSILRSTQAGFANRDGPGNSPDARFEADGTRYNLPTEGREATLIPDDDDVTVDFRGFDTDLGPLEFADGPDTAEIVVTLVLSDGTAQEFYFRQA